MSGNFFSDETVQDTESLEVWIGGCQSPNCLVLIHLLVLACREIAETMFTPYLEGMKHDRLQSGVVLAKLFVDVCKQILPVLVPLSAQCFAMNFVCHVLQCYHEVQISSGVALLILIM